jgi:hypothetical protein
MVEEALRLGVTKLLTEPASQETLVSEVVGVLKVRAGSVNLSGW